MELSARLEKCFCLKADSIRRNAKITFFISPVKRGKNDEKEVKIF